MKCGALKTKSRPECSRSIASEIKTHSDSRSFYLSYLAYISCSISPCAQLKWYSLHLTRILGSCSVTVLLGHLATELTPNLTFSPYEPHLVSYKSAPPRQTALVLNTQTFKYGRDKKDKKGCGLGGLPRGSKFNTLPGTDFFFFFF